MRMALFSSSIMPQHVENQKAAPFLMQDFYQIRDDCLATGKLFEDPEFQATSSSIFYSKTADIMWQRPSELTDNPEFILNGASRFDVMQGEMGNCWFLTGLANLTLNQKLFNYVVPNDQSFKENYAGIFHFRIWQFGKWIDVVVDDTLPTGKHGEGLLFVRSSEQREFWSPLLEKAYAKIYGSYEATKLGCNSESLEDLTGGIAEVFCLANAPAGFYETLLKAQKHMALLSCAVRKDNTMGLPSYHTYSITNVKILDETLQLLRIRNPWGEKTEWKGKWSDNSKEWERIPKYVQEEIGLVKAADGEFWMEYAEFVQYFQEVTICLLNPFCLDNGGDNCRPFKLISFMGAWTRGLSNGGNIGQETFSRNPQYIITLKETDDGISDKCTLVIGLMQKNRRSQFHLGKSNLLIGFYIFKLDKPDKHSRPLTSKVLNIKNLVASTNFRKVREITYRCSLPTGTYVIVPTTKDKDSFGRFMLRIFSEKSCVLRQNHEKVEIHQANPKVYGFPSAITSTIKNNITKCGSIEIFDTENVKKLEADFKIIAGNKSEIKWMQLQYFLNSTADKGSTYGKFSKQTIRSMIAAVDLDKSGKIGFDECRLLLTTLNNLKKYDKRATGYMDITDLKSALHISGLIVNNELLNIINIYYGNNFEKIAFDDFVMVVFKLTAIIGIISERNSDEIDQAAQINEWLEIYMNI